jgi:hypothetical protein
MTDMIQPASTFVVLALIVVLIVALAEMTK